MSFTDDLKGRIITLWKGGVEYNPPFPEIESLDDEDKEVQSEWVVYYKNNRPNECYGPFKDSAAAIEWAEIHDDDWTVVPITNVDIEEDDGTST